jgi:Predicted transcriptional regulators
MGQIKRSSTNCVNWEKYIVPCDLTYAATRITGRWKIPILSKLEGIILRFSELRDALPGITERMLILQLKELEKDKLIKRTAYKEVPLRVEYELTEIAEELIPVWRVLEKWGEKHKQLLELSADNIR